MTRTRTQMDLSPSLCSGRRVRRAGPPAGSLTSCPCALEGGTHGLGAGAAQDREGVARGGADPRAIGTLHPVGRGPAWGERAQSGRDGAEGHVHSPVLAASARHNPQHPPPERGQLTSATSFRPLRAYSEEQATEPRRGWPHPVRLSERTLRALGFIPQTFLQCLPWTRPCSGDTAPAFP